jgi:hypothetical protein
MAVWPTVRKKCQVLCSQSFITACQIRGAFEELSCRVLSKTAQKFQSSHDFACSLRLDRFFCQRQC